MQRGILFLLFISSFLRLAGQSNTASVELAFEYDAPGRIECKALVKAKEWSLSNQLQLQEAQDLQVYLIKAGSRKELDFKYDGQELSLSFNSIPHPLAQLELHYFLDQEFLEAKDDWTFLKEGFLLNEFNMGEKTALRSEEGLLFPCFSGEKHFWSLNIIIPENWEVNSPFIEEYRVNLKSKMARYFSSAKALSPASLYLAAGKFESDEADEILEFLERQGEIVQVSQEERLIATMQGEHEKLLTFLAIKRGVPWSQKKLEDLLEPTDKQEELYLKYEMLSENVGTKKQFLAEQRILINAAESEEQASLWQEEFYQQKYGSDYLDLDSGQYRFIYTNCCWPILVNSTNSTQSDFVISTDYWHVPNNSTAFGEIPLWINVEKNSVNSMKPVWGNYNCHFTNPDTGDSVNLTMTEIYSSYSNGVFVPQVQTSTNVLAGNDSITFVGTNLGSHGYGFQIDKYRNGYLMTTQRIQWTFIVRNSTLGIEDESLEREVIGVWDWQGRYIQKDIKGLPGELYLIRYNDGSYKKIFKQ